MKNSDLQTIDNIKVGFLNGVFKSPALIIAHLQQVFCGATITTIAQTENSFSVHCVSGQWEREPYSKILKFTFVKRDDGTNKIIDIEEITE